MSKLSPRMTELLNAIRSGERKVVNLGGTTGYWVFHRSTDGAYRDGHGVNATAKALLARDLVTEGTDRTLRLVESVAPLDLTTLVLDEGAHDGRDDGVCLLEAVAWWAGEAHTDHPTCVSEVLAGFGRSLNDRLPVGRRQELRSFIPQMPGTADDGLDAVRGYLALDWLVRTHTPAWLDLAGLTAEATALRVLRRIVDPATAQAAGPVVRDATAQARAARAVAGAVVRDAVWATAGDAVRDAVWATAGAVVRDAVWATAGDAVRAAAWAAVRDAVRAAVGDAVRDAAVGDAVRAAVGDADIWDAVGDAVGDAAIWDAAWERLAPTVDQLQSSAIALFGRMIPAELDTDHVED